MLIECGSCLVATYTVWCILYASTQLRFFEDGTEALKHVGVLTKYFNIYVYAFVGMNNKQYKLHGI